MRKRRKKSEIPFADALEFARKRLVKAQKELAVAQDQVTSLSAEIPTLESAIDVLEKALDPSKIRQPVIFQDGPVVYKFYGSGLPKKLDSNIDVGAIETEDDTLPEPEGAELLPE